MVRGDSIDIHCSLEKCTEALRIGRLAERSLFINIMFRLLKEDALILFFPRLMLQREFARPADESGNVEKTVNENRVYIHHPSF